MAFVALFTCPRTQKEGCVDIAYDRNIVNCGVHNIKTAEIDAEAAEQAKTSRAVSLRLAED